VARPRRPDILAILALLSSLHDILQSLTPDGAMELPIIVVNFLYAILGVVLMYVSYRVIDALTPGMDFRDELQKGNIAVAIFIAALFLSIAIVVAGALN
jgi:putative membrane protein